MEKKLWPIVKSNIPISIYESDTVFSKQQQYIGFFISALAILPKSSKQEFNNLQ